MNKSVCGVMMGVAGLAVLGMTAMLAGAQTDGAMAQAPDVGCALPSEPKGIPAAIDAAISGPADEDRACMKALLIPEARLMFVSLGADGTPSYRLETLDDWIARVKARGHAMLEEKQLKFHIERYGNIAHLWSSYALHSDGKQVARGINSIQAIKEAGGWRVTGIMGAGRVGHCAAAQGISAVREASLRAASRRGPAARAICGSCSALVSNSVRQGAI